MMKAEFFGEPVRGSSVYVKPIDGDEWQELGTAIDGTGFTFDETSEWNQEQIRRQAAMYQIAAQSYTTMTFHAQQVSNAFRQLLYGLNWQRKPLLHNGRKATARRRKK
jgi:hypothetical protein